MTSALAVAATAGAILGLAGWLLAIWLPLAIEDEQAQWSAGAEGTAPPQPVAMKDRIGESLVSARVQALGLIAANTLIAVWIVAAEGWTGQAVVLLLLSSALLALGLADWRSRLLPDILTQPMIWLGLLVQLIPATRTTGIESAVLGAVLGYMLPWSIGAARLMMGWRDSVGGGDLKLTALLGAWLGPIAALWALFAASVVGVIVHGAMVLLGKRQATELFPFGPWLALAGIGWIIARV